MSNTLHRNDKRLLVKMKICTSANDKPGEVFEVIKSDLGTWTGGGYCFPVSMLRNGDICEILERN